jgi:hypothetical protein
MGKSHPRDNGPFSLKSTHLMDRCVERIRHSQVFHTKYPTIRSRPTLGGRFVVSAFCSLQGDIARQRRADNEHSVARQGQGGWQGGRRAKGPFLRASFARARIIHGLGERGALRPIRVHTRERIRRHAATFVGHTQTQ